MSRFAMATFYVSNCALAGVVAAASNPDFYLWGLLPIAVGAAAWELMSNPASRKLFLRAFVAVGLVSFTVGRFCFEDHQLTDRGIVLVFMLGVLPAITSAVWIYYYEKEYADRGAA